MSSRPFMWTSTLACQYLRESSSTWPRKKSPLQGSVVTLDHGKAVENDRIAFLQSPICRWVVSSVCVQWARLKPNPSVQQLCPVTCLFGNLLLHGSHPSTGN